MTFKRLALGASGEELAARHLQACGYRILERNYRRPCGEVDIVADESGTIVFVEVKTRAAGSRFGSPLEAVGRKKQEQLARVAQEYLASHGLHQLPARFDVVGVVLGNREPRLELVRNAFELPFF